MDIDLNSIQLTNIAAGLESGNTLMYGLPKVGKTTFATKIPGYFLAATERGYNYLKVYKQDISSWQDFLDLCKAFTTQKHNYKTLVIDTADNLYKYCEQYTMLKHQVQHPSDLGFGKGFALVKEEFSRVIDKLNKSGMNLAFISHAKEKTQKTKSGEWTVMGTSLSGTPETFLAGLCDHIFYFYISDSGERLMRTKPTKYVLAGDRSALLPEIMPIDFNLVSDYLTGKKKLTEQQVEQVQRREEINKIDKVVDGTKLKNYALDVKSSATQGSPQ